MLEDLQVSNQEIVLGDLMFFVADVFTTGVQYGQRDDLCSKIVTTAFKRDLFRNFGIQAMQLNVIATDYDRKVLQNTTHDINKNIR